MARIAIPEKFSGSMTYSGGLVQKLINVTQATWHAQMAGGAPLNVTAGFTDPDAAEADRIPELALTAGGTPGTYTLTGTWNGAAQTEDILTVAGATVKGNLPFDAITSLVGPDPVQPLDIYKGDSYADPPAWAVYSGAGGDLEVMLSGESAVKTLSSVAAGIDLERRARRVGHDNTTIAAPYFVW